ncbi:MAG TPA: hypothetical protein VN461_23635 [Vicinamibacteria bacterium]|jgi:hypothetical protein|nr:hypothetical protein [Vicinamibacteria bacterium]
MNRRRLGALLAALSLCAGVAAQAGSPHSLKLKLESATTVKGETLAPGDYTLSWTPQGNEAEVTIAQRGKVVAKAKATLLEKEKAAPDDMVVFRKGNDGAQVISEIRHRGDKAVLVLPAS